MPKGDLIPHRWVRFAQEYAVDMNGKAAALRAGYAEGSADRRATELMQKPVVQQMVKQVLDKIAKRLEITAERTMREIARRAYYDPRKLFDANGKLLPIHMLDEDLAAVVDGYDYNIDAGSIIKMKLADKGKALDQCMSILGLHKTHETPALGALIQLILSDGKPL